MNKYKVVFKDGREIIVCTNCGYYWGYDLNLRAEMLFIAESQFKAENILGVIKIEP